MINYNATALIGKISDLANKLILLELEKEGISNLAPSHGEILVHLYQKDGLSIRELTEKINRTQPTVTVLVDKLKKLGYVDKIKSQTDSRVSHIYLSEKGKKLEPIFHQVSAKLNEVIYGSFNDLKKEQLEQFLNQILERFSQSNIG